jgi:polysaccharide biosynthesis protein
MKKEDSKDRYSHILRYTGLFGGVQGLNILIGIVRNKLVAMILGPNGMGLISLFNSTIKLVSDSTSFGISMSAVRNISEDFDRQNIEKLEADVALVRSWSFLTALLGMFVCIAFSPLLSSFTFSWHGHTLHFIFLSPIVAMTAITGGELAVLKGVRRLKALAGISVYSVIGALLVSVPLYYIYKERAIVPSLVIMAFIQMALTIAVSYKIFPLRLSLSRSVLRQGYSMIRLGIAFVFAGILGSGADFVIRSYISNVAGIDTVGLFNAGYMLTMTYVGTVFSAMETDFFPRLSGVSSLGFTFNRTVSNQIEVMLLLVSPLLVVFTFTLPILLPLLYTGKFLPALGMIQIIVLAMYFRALKLPVEYIPLAKGDSLSYLFLEAFYDIVLVVLVIILFRKFGLTGAGVAVTLAGIIDFIVVFIYARLRYAYKPTAGIVKYTLIQLPIGLLAYASTWIADPRLYWSIGALLAILSMAASLSILRKKTRLWAALMRKLNKAFRRDE